MSDFLTRIAARAVGEAPTVVPHAPTLREVRAGVTTRRSGSIVEKQVLVQASAAAHEHAPPENDRGAAPVPPPVGEAGFAAPSERRESRAAATKREAEPAAVASRLHRPASRPSRPSRGGEPGPDRLRGAPRAAPVDPVPPALPGRAVPVVVVAATPPPLAAFVVPPVAATPATATKAGDEAPAVRVHIGRLEVRANLQEAPVRREPARAPVEPRGISLSDYLRGRREAVP